MQGFQGVAIYRWGLRWGRLGFGVWFHGSYPFERPWHAIDQSAFGLKAGRQVRILLDC